ncbi:hypothetical protein FHU33_1550 [Blastococcus colisei]|uniref:Uncharacterized protein n=1 Tax=Blastococcus colisei TaxID=1564162 RepID=A0A543PDJ7_9ACTN|nr:hypothetical protein [Blastococcus colisei]TQN42156.1 hypothetical protein FHU33_1550 [Blastococcus colisei]
MSEGSMTGRPYGGANDPTKDDGLPGEVPEDDEVRAAPEQSPRAAKGGMSDEGGGVPGSGTSPNSSGPPNTGNL